MTAPHRNGSSQAGIIAPATRLSTDVLVVGSGAGGATTAAILAEAGFDVLIVEEGPWVDQDTVAPFSLDQMDRQYRAGGVTVALGLPSIAVVERWRDDYRIDGLDLDELASIADEVEQAINVTLVPGKPTPASEMLRRGAASLGWKHSEIPRWMIYPPGGDARTGKRQSMTRTYLPRAFAAGAAREPSPRPLSPTPVAARAPSPAGTSSCAEGPSSRPRCCSARACTATSAARSPCTPP